MSDNSPFLEDFEKPKEWDKVNFTIQVPETFAEAHVQNDGFVHDVVEVQESDIVRDEEEAEGVIPSLKMTKAELVAIAEQRGIKVVPDDMTKADILDALNA